jgi:hypothetical protein
MQCEYDEAIVSGDVTSMQVPAPSALLHEHCHMNIFGINKNFY